MIFTRRTTSHFVTGVALSAALAGYLTLHPEALRDNRDVQVHTAVRAGQQTLATEGFRDSQGTGSILSRHPIGLTTFR